MNYCNNIVDNIGAVTKGSNLEVNQSNTRGFRIEGFVPVLVDVLYCRIYNIIPCLRGHAQSLFIGPVALYLHSWPAK
jgi:hypothetical protein